MLTFSRVSKSFSGRVALSDVTLTVPAGSRTAVVGVNGSGKSTLLRLAAGVIAPDSGSVRTAPGTAVAYVPQDYGFVVGDSVETFLKERAGVLGLERRLRALERALADGDDGAAEDYVAATDAYAALGGYEVDGRIERALKVLSLPPALLRRPLGELSGGQQVRVGLAGVLASRFSLYLLDEPTNNLDLDALGVLEDFVAATDATFLLVSHDRAFLDATATDVVKLSEHDHTAVAYGVSYAEYRGLREQVRAAQSARYAAYLAEVQRLQAAVRAQRAKAAKTKDSRAPRDNDKSARNFFAETSSRQAGKATKALEQRLARVQAVPEPRNTWQLRLDLSRASRSGDLVALLEDASKTYGDFTLGPLSLALHWRDRVALQGHNGAGKSVLLSLLTAAVAPDAGTARLGQGVVVGVLRQSGTDLAGDGSGLAVFQRHVGGPESDARTLLAKFDLGADHVLRPVATYSPGERCRLGLAILMSRGANWLVLDEPTNHLDLEAQEELEQALIAFDGTLLVVSHDREFCQRIGLSRRWHLADGRLLADVPA